MVSANDRILDAAIRAAHSLEKYKNGEVKRILETLNRDVYPALIDELQKRLSRITAQGFDRGVESTKRLQDLTRAIEKLIAEGMKRAEEKLTGDVKDLAEVQAKSSALQLKRAIEVDVDVLLPSRELLHELATKRPFSGSTLSEHFENLTASSQKAIRRGLNIGLTSGEGFDQITARIVGTEPLKFRDGALELSRRQARSVVGAAVQHAGAMARKATYEENSDIIKGEVWTATLDSRTCPQCQALDGEEFPLGEGPQAPIHLGPCRCVRVPVLKSWKEMGFDVDELPASTRASMDGQVADDLTYGEWIKRQSAAVQDEALGPTRAKLLRSGGIDIDQFVDDRGQLLNLDQLRGVLGLDE